MTFEIQQSTEQFYNPRPDLRLYAQTYLRRAVGPERVAELLPTVEQRALSFIQGSENAARITSSPEYQQKVNEIKRLRGNSTLGVTVCIDGRQPPILIPGPIADTFEAKAGIIQVHESPLDGKLEIESPRLIEALIERPSKDVPQVLEILTAHRAAKPNCAAMEERLQREQVAPHTKDLVEANLAEHEKSAQAIANHYNRAARRVGKVSLNRVAISAVYDMQTAGFEFGYGSDNTLHTTDILKKVLHEDGHRLQYEYGEPGFIHDFTDPRQLLPLEFAKGALTKSLLSNSILRHHVDQFLMQNYSDLTLDQTKALKVFMAYNAALQYATGLFEGGNHALSAHNEQYMSFSSDGARIGDRDPSIQSFGATIASVEDAIDHLVTKTQLMEGLKKTTPPFIAFVSKASSEKVTPATHERDRSELRGLLYGVLQNGEIQHRVRNGELVIIPAFVHERTHRILDIPNLAA